MIHSLPKSLIEDSKSLLLEKKDHLIRRLKNLTDEQKEEIIQFFRKKPNLENKIDWNRRDLTYDDFLEVMDVSRIIAKRRVVRAQGIRGLKEGDDYIALEAPEGVDAYIPLNWEASKKIACSDIGTGEGRWCTAWVDSSEYWNKYTRMNNILIYILYSDTKEAIRFDRENNIIREIRDKENKSLSKTEVHSIILRKNMREIMNVKIENEISEEKIEKKARKIAYEKIYNVVDKWKHRGPTDISLNKLVTIIIPWFTVKHAFYSFDSWLYSLLNNDRRELDRAVRLLAQKSTPHYGWVKNEDKTKYPNAELYTGETFSDQLLKNDTLDFEDDQYSHFFMNSEKTKYMELRNYISETIIHNWDNFFYSTKTDYEFERKIPLISGVNLDVEFIDDETHVGNIVFDSLYEIWIDDLVDEMDDESVFAEWVDDTWHNERDEAIENLQG